MELASYLFYFFVGFTILSAFYIAVTANVLHAALGLLGTFLGVAGLYVFAGADFVGVTQIIVYVGGILVLIMLGVMLSTRNTHSMKIISGVRRKLVGYLVAGGFFVVLLVCVLAVNMYLEKRIAGDSYVQKSTINDIGVNLMTDYIVPFELSAIILLVALIGAAFIAAKRRKGEKV